jgi:hypothetical protein
VAWRRKSLSPDAAGELTAALNTVLCR